VALPITSGVRVGYNLGAVEVAEQCRLTSFECGLTLLAID